jgi:nitroreductase
LQEPAPNQQELSLIQAAAMRVPDHARLRPWRFLLIAGDARGKLGELFAQAMLTDQADCDEQSLNKARANPLRAPLLVTVVAKTQDHPKVPVAEQLQSAGCAAHNLLLAAEALGYAGIWRTGPMADHAVVNKGLGLEDNEVIVGYVYLGTRLGEPKPIALLPIDDYWQTWNGDNAF